jgi:hypothetical protein
MKKIDLRANTLPLIDLMKELIRDELATCEVFWFSLNNCVNLIDDIAHFNRIHLSDKQIDLLVDWMMNEPEP